MYVCMCIYEYIYIDVLNKYIYRERYIDIYIDLDINIYKHINIYIIYI